MLSITSDKPILKATDHRPWPLPSKAWEWYQEWNEVVFLHWKVPHDWLFPQIPAGLTIDTFGGNCWISLVAFNMDKARPRLLPAFAPLSDFYELNIRTYVEAEGKAGVYFLSIEASKQISCFMARRFSGLPYVFSKIERAPFRFTSKNPGSGNHFDINYLPGAKKKADELDLWLTERYCLYHDIQGDIYRYEVQHKQWDVYQLELKSRDIKYDGYQTVIQSAPDRCHYSPGIPVLAYPKEKIYLQ